MKKNENIMTFFILGVLVVIISIFLIATCIRIKKDGKRISELESAVTAISTEATTMTEETTISTTTAITQPEKPLIVLDMQRRLDTLMLMAKYAKPEVEKIMELQNNGGTLSDEQHSLLQWYAAVIIEENQLTNAINEKLEQ